MKANRTLVILLALLLPLTMLASCQEAQKTADLTVTLDENSRTLSSKNTDFDVTNYLVECASHGGGDPITMTTSRTSFVIQGLPVGTYTISATGRNDSGQSIVKGSTNFNLTTSNRNAVIVLKELIGEGGLNIKFTWDSSLASDAVVKVSLEPADGQTIETVTQTLESVDGSATFTQSGLPSGSYILTAGLYSGSTMLAGSVEAVRISNNDTVEGTISLSLDSVDTSQTGKITLENMAGIPVECSIVGFEEGTTVQAQVEKTITFSASGLDEEELTVIWYLDGVKIGSGLEIDIIPEPGVHRLDVVASTDKLGSSGSASVTFESAILGQDGVPVLGSMITEETVDGISISDDMLLEFLPDGNLLVMDNGSRKAQVAAVKKNTIELLSSQNMAQPVEALAALYDTDNVVMVYSDSMEAMSYTYNSGTGRLEEAFGNNGTPLADEGRYIRIYGIVPGWPYADGGYGIYASIDAAAEGDDQYIIDLISIHSAIDEDKVYIRTDPPQQNAALANKVDIFSSLPNGDGVLGIDSDTGKTSLSFPGISDASNIEYMKHINGEVVTGVTAATALPSGSTRNIRFVVASGDTFHFYETDRDQSQEGGYTEAGSMDRSEGNGLDTVQLLLSDDENFLYALNSGNKSVSTYSVSWDGELEYVGITDLSFVPESATVNTDGDYMAIRGTNGELALMRIKH